MAKLRLRIVGALALFVVGCAAAPRSQLVSVAHGGVHYGFRWFEGSVEAAFALAAAQGKPLFLYWGAVWCPPCRALKAEVFPSARFAELMHSFVPVYLDGDAAEAQSWADKLQVSSYPAMLVVDADGHEQMRMLGGAELADVDAALSSVIASRVSLRSLVEKALQTPVQSSPEDWSLLSLVTWDDPALVTTSDDQREANFLETLRTVGQLVERVPPVCVEAAARLTGSLLELAAVEAPAGREQWRTVREEVRGHCARHLDAILHDSKSLLAARHVLRDSSLEIATFCQPDPRSDAFVRLAQRLTEALHVVAARSDSPVEDRLAAASAEAGLWKHGHPQQAVPAELRGRVAAIIKQAFAIAPSQAIRHTVVTAAADALHATGDDEAARNLLAAELPSSRVPWYLQAELAEIAASRGNAAEALEWSGQAARSAQGNATRVQWRASDLKLLLRLHPDAADGEIVPRLRELYDLVDSLPDGFAGRNRRRLRVVSSAISKVAERAVIHAFLVERQEKCASLEESRKEICASYFEALTRVKLPNHPPATRPPATQP